MSKTLKTVSPDFDDYTITPEGIVDRPNFGNRMALVTMRDEMLEGISGVCADPGTSEQDDAVIRLMVVHWLTLAMKLAWATRMSETVRGAGGLLQPSSRFPFSSAIARGDVPPDEIWLKTLSEGPKPYPFWRWPLRLARQIVRKPAIGARPGRLIRWDRDVAVTSAAPLINRHAALSERSVYYVDLCNWFGPVDLDSSAPASDAHLACAKCLTDAIDLTSAQSDWLTRQVVSTARLMRAHVERLRERDDIPAHLWNGSNSSIWDRAVGIECLRRGKEVVAHDHGTGGGVFFGGKSFVLRGCCSKLATFTDRNKDWLETMLPMRGIASHAVPKVEVVPMGEGDRQRQGAAASADRTQSERSVLLVPLPPPGEFMQINPYPDDFVALDFTARLAGALGQRGWDVVLKPHPEFGFPDQSRWQGFSNLGFETGPFESVFRQHHVVLYGYQNTTALRAAETAGHPAMILTQQKSPWLPEARKDYEERFEILDVSVNDDAALEVDFDAVDSGLSLAVDRRSSLQ